MNSAMHKTIYIITSNHRNRKFSASSMCPKF